MGKAKADIQLTAIEVEEINAKKKALKWVTEESDNRSCPFCAWESQHEAGVGETTNPFLEGHLSEKHPTATLIAFQQQTLNPNLRADDPEVSLMESLGFEVEENDKFDALYVPTEVRQEAARNGDHLRWAAPDKLQHYLDGGCFTVPLPSDAQMPKQGSTADSKVRANEMVLIRVPERKHKLNRQKQEARTTQNIASCREELEKIRGGIAEKAFTYAKKRGATNQQAMNVANAIEAGEERGTLPGTRMTITDQHGTDTS